MGAVLYKCMIIDNAVDIIYHIKLCYNSKVQFSPTFDDSKLHLFNSPSQ